MRIKFIGVLLFFFFTQASLGQDQVAESYEDLLSHIEMHQGNPKVWVYLDRYLQKAKSERNWNEIVGAYGEMMHECLPAMRLIYADSMVIAAKQSKNTDLIGSAYLSKGSVHFQKKQHHLALDNYLLANKYLVSTKDHYLIHKTKYSIAQIKYYLGYYNEAIALYSDCLQYYKEGEPMPYLYSIQALALCYLYTGNLEMAGEFNNLSVSETKRLKAKSMLPYTDMAKGIWHYKSGNYTQAKKYLSFALPPIAKQGDFANEAVTNFYLGKALWALSEKESAIANFIRVDDAFVKHNYIRPDLREAYEFLIPYFQKKDRPREELKYIDRLLTADSILNAKFSYLVKKVHKEYDTRELLTEKERIERDLEKSTLYGYMFKSLVAALSVAVIYLVQRHVRLKKLHKQRFEELLKNGHIRESKNDTPFPEVIDINPEIVHHINERLAEFEDKSGFLRKDLTATKLAEQFGTNYKYLSKVIRHGRQKSFVNYINDLRIDYILQRLKNEPLLRKYTNFALASEAGFSTAQHFMVAFKKRTGISPTYFVDEYGKISPRKD